LTERGLTLIETMIAVAILSVICLGLVQAVLVSLQATEEAARQTDITTGALEILNKLLALPYDTLLQADGRKFKLLVDGRIIGEGVVRISGDINGDGLVTPGPPYFENRQFAVRVSICFEGKTVVERIVTRMGGLLR